MEDSLVGFNQVTFFAAKFVTHETSFYLARCLALSVVHTPVLVSVVFVIALLIENVMSHSSFAMTDV